jgi:hypothetical protein
LDARISKENYVKHYKKYVKAMLKDGSGIVSPKEMMKRLSIGVDIYEILNKQYDVMEATKVNAMLASPIEKLSQSFLSQTPHSVSMHQARVAAASDKSILDKAAFCVGTSAVSPVFYELHFYAVKEASCNALQQSKLPEARAIQVNSDYQGICSRDVSVGWTGREKSGVNHVVLTINAQGFRGY